MKTVPPPGNLSQASSWWRHLATLASLAVLLCSSLLDAQSAEISPSDLAQLTAEARASGAAPVIVHLQPSTPADLVHRSAELAQSAKRKEVALLRELGDTVFQHGRWSSHAGQIGLHITEEGLSRLRSSGQALRVIPGFGWRSRTPLLELDGAHDVIEQQLRSNGTVELDVVLNASGLMIEHQQHGQAQLNASDQSIRAALNAWGQLLASATRAEVVEIAPSAAPDEANVNRTDVTSLRRTVRVSRGGLLLLADSSAIRSIRPAGSIDSRPRRIDQELFRQLDQAATIEVELSLRTELMGGRLSQESLQALTESNRRTLGELLAIADIKGERVDMSRLGVVGLKLGRSQLERLASLQDRRLLALTANRVMAKPHMIQLGQSANLPWAYEQGFRGAGQTLLIFDTGIQSSHPFLGNRISDEACFSTDNPSIPLLPTCPPPHVAGTANTLLNWPGSGEPIPGSSHGTHVAGIAAGSSSSMRGPAPEARIGSIRVFSKSPAGAPLVSWSSLLQALNEAVQQLPQLPGGAKQPYTINMSIGMYDFGNVNACLSPQLPPLNDIPNMAAFVTAIHSLNLAGIPVVSSVGNEQKPAGISWPACLPGVVKVTSLSNLAGPPFTRATTSNAVNRNNFPNEIFWAAPGGGTVGPGPVNSSVLLSAYQFMGGTSMASPHVAGLYAAAKGAAPSWGVHEATAWFLLNAAINVDLTFPDSSSYTWPMIKLNPGQ